MGAADVEDCFDDCLPRCVEDTANNYLDCMYYRSGSSSCNREDCFNRLVIERQWIDDDTLESSYNFFDTLSERLDDIRDDGNVNSCRSTEEKAIEICDINDFCCPVCEDELSDAMDCVINKVIRPILGVINAADCDTNCRSLLNRRLQSIELDASNAVMNGNDSNNDDKMVTVVVETTTNEDGEKVTTTTTTTAVTKTTTTKTVEVLTTKETSDGDNVTVTTMDPVITSSVVSTTTTAAGEPEEPTSSGITEIDDGAAVTKTTEMDDGAASTLTPSDNDENVRITFADEGLIKFGQDLNKPKETTALEKEDTPAKECKSRLTK